MITEEHFMRYNAYHASPAVLKKGGFLRLTPVGDKQVRIDFADQQEAQRWQMEEANMRRLMPNLMKLWEVEPRFLVTKKDFWELLKSGVGLGDFKVSDAGWLTGAGEFVLAQVESDKKAGRPLSQRTLVAAMRLLMFAPSDRVFAMEKRWQEKKCMAEVRDRCVAREVREARVKAAKDAENTVARAREMVTKACSDYLEKYPQHLVYFLVGDSVVSEVLAGSKKDGAGPTQLNS